MSNEWTLTLTRPWHLLSNAGVVTGHEATTIDYSMDTISARAQCRFAGNQRQGVSLFPAVDVNQQVSIVGGYRDRNGALSTVPLFNGFIEEDGASFSSSKLGNVVSLGDQMRLTQFTLGDPRFNETPFDRVAIYDGTYGLVDPITGVIDGSVPSATNNAPGGSWTDTMIVQDLLRRAGVNSAAMAGIGGAGVILGSSIPVILSNKLAPGSLITQIDQATGCKTFSTPTGPQRVVTTFTPTTGAAWTLRQGIEIIDIDNVRSLKAFYNRVIVRGLKLGGSEILSIRSAPANLPSIYGGTRSLPFGRASGEPITYTFSSDLIQSQSVADALSASLLIVGNRLERRVKVKTRFNPDAIPGQTVAVFAPNAKIYSTLNGYALGIAHSLDSSGAFTTWTLAIYDTGGGSGSLGSGSTGGGATAGTSPSPPPSLFVLTPTVQSFTNSSTGQQSFSVSLDASSTRSAGFPFSSLIFNWSDAFGGSGTAPTYTFVTTATGSTPVVLTVTDPNGRAASTTINVILA